MPAGEFNFVSITFELVHCLFAFNLLPQTSLVVIHRSSRSFFCCNPTRQAKFLHNTQPVARPFSQIDATRLTSTWSCCLEEKLSSLGGW